ncbi:proteasome inhibitor PI31 subunit-like [Planococcus citri]|uniref:proteasome inhibitor PI31 subunit-like n=1 Tax=Planococcus citri TaxID=170843 RepID=UPI0031F8C50E
MADQFFGWELLFNNVKSDIKKKEDVLMLLIHYSLIKNGFKCVGVNDDWKSEAIEISSELLPKEWNANKEYVFRYQYNEEKYVLQSNHSDNSTIIFNLMDTKNLKVSNVMFNYENSVGALEGNISAVLPSHLELFNKLQRDLISGFVSNEKKTVETQTTSTESSDKKSDPLIVPSLIPQARPPYQRGFEDFPSFEPIGRRDLDPLAAVGQRNPLAVGGGMLFDPFQENRSRLLGGPIPGPGVPRGLPRGAAPPGSRFDPFGPPDAHPGPGRFPPEYDDMFS